MSEPTTEDIQTFYEKAFEKPNPQRERAGNLAAPPSHEYQQLLLTKIHPELKKLNFGCGSPFPSGDLTGFNVLDLGSGSGRDCYIMSALTGDTGSVLGIDLSPKVVELAKTFKDFHREAYGLTKDIVDFKQGNIEDLRPVAEDESVDLVISNCVVNLAKSKENVFKEVHRVLREGGEFYFSDIYTSSRLGKNVKENKELWGSCYAGAHYVSDFHHMLKRIGFSNFQIVSARVLKKSKVLESKLKDDDDSVTVFYSITLRAFKVIGEPEEEDYGQTATYIGEKYGDEFIYSYDQRFPRGVSKKVSGNTAENLKRSKYGKYFEITEPGTTHRGRFLNSMSYWEILDEVLKNTRDEEIGNKKCTSGKCPLEKPKKSNSCSSGKCAMEKPKEKSSGGCCGSKKKEEKKCCSKKNEEVEGEED